MIPDRRFAGHNTIVCIQKHMKILTTKVLFYHSFDSEISCHHVHTGVL